MKTSTYYTSDDGLYRSSDKAAVEKYEKKYGPEKEEYDKKLAELGKNVKEARTALEKAMSEYEDMKNKYAKKYKTLDIWDLIDRVFV